MLNRDREHEKVHEVNKNNYDYKEIENIADLEFEVYKKADLYENEESTKQGLILPLLTLMGYETRNVNDVYPEYDVPDIGKADYVLRLDGEFKQIVEAKRLNKNMLPFIPQLKSYFDNIASANLGILTDGNHYLFFTDMQEKGMMDSKPFLVISNINNFRNNRVATLWELYRVTRFDKKYVDNRIIEADSQYLTDYQKVMKDYKALKLTKKEQQGLSYVLGENS